MSANDTQVGGSHYKSQMQHWDFVIANELNYFEGQITKYVSRCRKKNGIEDLKKAKHFLEKYIENFEYLRGTPFIQENLVANPDGSLSRFELQHPQYLSDLTFRCEGGRGDGMILYTHLPSGEKLWASGLVDAHKQAQDRGLPAQATQVGHVAHHPV